MEQIATNQMQMIANYTGDTTISSTNIPEKYQNILINLTTALVASRIHGIGAQFNWNLGDFSVNKGKGSSPEADQVEWFLKLARDELEFIGKDTPYYQTWNQ